MITKYFKCTLKTDVIINASLATEGNMKTLDYIPGSNFLGVVARSYDRFKAEKKAFDIFHSGDVSFGDAHISIENTPAYPMPFNLFVNKLNKAIAGEKAKVWVHHFLEKNKENPDPELKEVQLKQHRGGYFNINQQFITVQKRFVLKSAQDRQTRRSRDKAMFGFESIKKDQTFIFSVKFKDETYVEEVTNELIGNKRIGKSKSAQYGQVFIETKNEITDNYKNRSSPNDHLVIYAESNLCLFNELGQATFSPRPQHFGFNEEQVQINFAYSQIRTYSYSPWNTFRDSTDPQRDCILKGSIIIFDIKDKKQPLSPTTSMVGAYNAEGLGRVIYNPAFLDADASNGRWSINLNKHEAVNELQNAKPIHSPLGKYLEIKKLLSENNLAIGKAVQAFIEKKDHKGNVYKDLYKTVTTSQWGGIRRLAVKAESIDELRENLFGKNEAIKKDNPGFLMNGVAAERIWDKQKGKLKTLLLKEILDAKVKRLPPDYFAKLAAEMAKLNQLESSESKN